jgi:hypothetical protein
LDTHILLVADIRKSSRFGLAAKRNARHNVAVENGLAVRVGTRTPPRGGATPEQELRTRDSPLDDWPRRRRLLQSISHIFLANHMTKALCAAALLLAFLLIWKCEATSRKWDAFLADAARIEILDAAGSLRVSVTPASNPYFRHIIGQIRGGARRARYQLDPPRASFWRLRILNDSGTQIFDAPLARSKQTFIVGFNEYQLDVSIGYFTETVDESHFAGIPEYRPDRLSIPTGP